MSQSYIQPVASDLQLTAHSIGMFYCLHVTAQCDSFKTSRSRSWSRSRHENTDSGVGVDSDENPIDSAALAVTEPLACGLLKIVQKYRSWLDVSIRKGIMD